MNTTKPLANAQPVDRRVILEYRLFYGSIVTGMLQNGENPINKDLVTN
jgi:hypothetical protein